MIFYAHKLEFIDRDAATRKCAMCFEAVPEELLRMFVTGEISGDTSSEALEFLEESKYFGETWNSFDQEGPDGEAFLENKRLYLSEIRAVQITLLFEEFGRAMELERSETDWWRIYVDFPGGDLPEDAVPVFIEDPAETLYAGYEPLSQEENNILYSLYVSEGRENHGGMGSDIQGTGQGILGNIAKDTQFGKVQVLYVGAGLSCRILDYTGHVVGYFDMGEELAFSAALLQQRAPFMAPMLNQVKQDSINIMKQDAGTGAALTVIISHWHYDHVRVLGTLAREYIRSGSYAAFWTNLTLICPAMVRYPGWSVMDYNDIRAVMSRLNQSGFQPVANVTNLQTVSFHPGSNDKITLYKGDIGGRRSVQVHPHNHGIAAVIRMGAGSGGNKVFLAGDCSYDTLNGIAGVLDNGGIGYEYLVATHHGGTYMSDLTSNPTYIPKPGVLGNARLVYSANGVAYGHPNPMYMGDYANRGWTNPICLHQHCRPGQICDQLL